MTFKKFVSKGKNKRTSLFVKYFTIFAAVFFICFFVVGSALIYFVNEYSLNEKTTLLEENTKTIAEVVSSGVSANEMNSKFSSDKEVVSDALAVVSNCIDADVFVCDTGGEVIMCKEQRGLHSYYQNSMVCDTHKNLKISDSIIQDVYENGKTVRKTTINGKKYCIVGTAISTSYYSNYEGSYDRITGTVFAIIETGITDLVVAVFKIFFTISLICLIIAFVTIWITTKRMVKPLTEMSNAAKKFAVGDFSYRVNISGNDELTDLGNAFNEMANALDKLENSRRSFVANVSHELKTPMTSIAGFIDGILDGTIPKEREKYYLKLVSDEVRRLSRLVVAMLNMSKIESGDLHMKQKNYNISDQIIHILLTFEQKIDSKNIEIIGLDNLGIHNVYADMDMIYQVVYNLFDNAVKFTNENGYIQISATQKDRMVEISIKNSGNGINSQELSKIFERFYKVDKSRSLDSKGAGLGLYIVKMMVEMHGGKIFARSDSVSEAEFVFTLPIAK